MSGAVSGGYANWFLVLHLEVPLVITVSDRQQRKYQLTASVLDCVLCYHESADTAQEGQKTNPEKYKMGMSLPLRVSLCSDSSPSSITRHPKHQYRRKKLSHSLLKSPSNMRHLIVTFIITAAAVLTAPGSFVKRDDPNQKCVDECNKSCSSQPVICTGNDADGACPANCSLGELLNGGVLGPYQL